MHMCMQIFISTCTCIQKNPIIFCYCFVIFAVVVLGALGVGVTHWREILCRLSNNIHVWHLAMLFVAITPVNCSD